MHTAPPLEQPKWGRTANIPTGSVINIQRARSQSSKAAARAQRQQPERRSKAHRGSSQSGEAKHTMASNHSGEAKHTMASNHSGEAKHTEAAAIASEAMLIRRNGLVEWA